MGQRISERLHKEFVDSDTEIVKQAGKSIPEIFEESGEEGFRKIETQVLDQLGKRSGLVIATGGGCVTRSENYPLLHQNGRIAWIKRDVSLLPKEGRPLSLSNKLELMYAVRKTMYEAFADIQAINDGTPEKAAAQILELEGYK